MRALLVFVGSFCIASCGGATGDSSAGGVTPEESQALNDAATMLDKQQPAPSVLGSENTEPVAKAN